MAHEDVLVLAPVAVLAPDAGPHAPVDLGDDEVGFLRREPLGTVPVECVEIARRMSLLDPAPRAIAARSTRPFAVCVGGPPIDW